MDAITKNMNNEVSSMELYYSGYSINSEKVLLCMFEKDVKFTGHYIDLFKFEQTNPAYLEINPLGLVPTLMVSGKPIPESTIINEFLDDAFPANPLRPKDSFKRAQMRVWVQRFQEKFYPAMAVISQVHFVAEELKRRWTQDQLEQLISRKPIAERVERQQRAVRDGLRKSEITAAERNAEEMLDKMEAQLTGGSEWLLGLFSLADIAAAPNVHRYFQLGLNSIVEKRPNVHAWYRRIRERPSFVRTYEYAIQDFS